MKVLSLVALIVFCLLSVTTAHADGLWETYTTDTEYSNYIIDMAVQGEYLWCVTAEGLVRWNLLDMTSYLLTVEDGFPGGFVTNVEIDSDGAVWLGLQDGGVCRYDGSVFTTFTVDDGLASNEIRYLAATSDGAVWAASYSDGISVYSDGAWSVFDGITELDDTNISAFATGADGSVWIGTGAYKLFRWDGESYTVFTEDDGLASNATVSLSVDAEGNVLAGGLGGGVSRWNGTSWAILREDFGSDLILQSKMTEARAVLRQISRQEQAYFETNGEYMNFDFGEDCPLIGFTPPDKETARFTYKFEDFIATAVEVVDVNEDGDTDDGLTLTVDEEQGVINDLSWEESTANAALAYCMLDDSPTVIWVGTAGDGLLCYCDDDWYAFTEDDGLASDYVLAIQYDQFGQLWVGTDRGLCLYTGEPVAVETSDEQPSEFPVISNYPNPFNPDTAIQYTVPHEGQVDVTVYNVAGQSVRTIVSGEMGAGVHTAHWDGRDSAGNVVASGIYFAVLKAGEYQAAHKMQFLR